MEEKETNTESRGFGRKVISKVKRVAKAIRPKNILVNLFSKRSFSLALKVVTTNKPVFCGILIVSSIVIFMPSKALALELAEGVYEKTSASTYAKSFLSIKAWKTWAQSGSTPEYFYYKNAAKRYLIENGPRILKTASVGFLLGVAVEKYTAFGAVINFRNQLDWCHHYRYLEQKDRNESIQNVRELMKTVYKLETENQHCSTFFKDAQLKAIEMASTLINLNMSNFSLYSGENILTIAQTHNISRVGETLPETLKFLKWKE